MGKRSKAPAPPDPTKVAQAQTQSNKDTAAYNASLNRGNSYTPLGSQTYNYRGADPRTGAPIYDETVSLSPDAQVLLDQQMAQSKNTGALASRLLNNVSDVYSQPLDTSSLPQVYGANDLQGARKEQQDALYRMHTAYLDPQMQDRERQLQTQMANQGVVAGSEAYNNATREFDRGREFSYGQARDQAITGGGEELSRLYGMSADARSRGLGELLTLRGLPMQELAGVSGMTGSAPLPQFSPAPGVTMPGTDVMGPIYQNYQGQIDAYNAKQAGDNALLSGLFSLGGAALGGPLGGIIGKKIGGKIAGRP